MLDERVKAQFRNWGREGGKRRAEKYTKKEISEMAKRAHRRKRRRNGHNGG